MEHRAERKRIESPFSDGFCEFCPGRINAHNGMGFFVAPDWTVDAGLTPYEGRVIDFLYRSNNKLKKVFPARETIAKGVNIGVRSVDRALSELKKKYVRMNEKGDLVPMLKIEHRSKNGKRTSSKYILPDAVKRFEYVSDESKPPERRKDDSPPASQAGRYAPDRQLLPACGAQEVQPLKGNVSEVQEESSSKEEAAAFLNNRNQDKDLVELLIDEGFDKEDAVEIAYTVPDGRDMDEHARIIRFQVRNRKCEDLIREKKKKKLTGPGWLRKAIYKKYSDRRPLLENDRKSCLDDRTEKEITCVEVLRSKGIDKKLGCHLIDEFGLDYVNEKIEVNRDSSYLIREISEDGEPF